MPCIVSSPFNGKDTNVFGKQKIDVRKNGDITFVTFHYYRGLPY